MASSLEVLEEGDRIGVMVDALTPFLVKHVKCLHLLNYLPFMRDQAARIRKLDRSGDHTGASELFLECLKLSEEPGRYASFRDALVEAKYDHIARVLDGGDIEENHSEHCKLIEVFAQPIIEKMDPIVMLQQLRQHELITEGEEDEIRNVHREHSRYDAAMTLLDCVHRRKLGWYDAFMTTMLEVYPHLVQLVDPYFKESKNHFHDLSLNMRDFDLALFFHREKDRQKAAQEYVESKAENNLSRERDDEEWSQRQMNSFQSTGSDVTDRHAFLETYDGREGALRTGEKGKDTPKCDIQNCVHCAILKGTVVQLRSEIQHLKDELDSLRIEFIKQMQSKPQIRK